MKYRDHRGSLDDSMKTVIEVSSIDDIKNHLNEIWKPFGKEVDEIKFDYSWFDERTGWNTYFVLQRLKGETRFTVAGMSDGKLNK